jgi:hypothetical protein
MMVSIDVHDLPEPIAQAIAAMVDGIRIRIALAKPEPSRTDRPAQLPIWPGKVLADFTRAADPAAT